MISRIVVGRGARRVSVEPRTKDDRRSAASQMKKFLFPTNGAFHKARRRGERSLALSAA